MKLKKMIEEEYRMAELRGKVELVAIYGQYWERVGVNRKESEGGKVCIKQGENKKRRL